MSWVDKGLIFKVKNQRSWITSHAFDPTVLELTDRIRVFVAFWDEFKYGRLGYIDVDSVDPTKILGYSTEPVLSDSQSPAFDSAGVTPLCIIPEVDHTKLYYAAWKIPKDTSIRYQLLTGLLIGNKNGEEFRRYDSDMPVMAPRSPLEHIRTGGKVIKTKEGYRCYLAVQKGTHNEYGKILPIYDLECSFSKNGIEWSNDQHPIFQHQQGKILGFGRSAIWHNDSGLYEGLFSVRNWDGTYSGMLYSSSKDGLEWQKLSCDNKAFLPSMTCDHQKEVCFPSLVFRQDQIFMFYNGNYFGKEGLRLAIWKDD